MALLTTHKGKEVVFALPDHDNLKISSILLENFKLLEAQKLIHFKLVGLQNPVNDYLQVTLDKRFVILERDADTLDLEVWKQCDTREECKNLIRKHCSVNRVNEKETWEYHIVDMTQFTLWSDVENIYTTMNNYTLTDDDKNNILNQMCLEFPIVVLQKDYYLIDEKKYYLPGLFGGVPPLSNIRIMASGGLTNQNFATPFESSKTDRLCQEIHAKYTHRAIDIYSNAKIVEIDTLKGEECLHFEHPKYGLIVNPDYQSIEDCFESWTKNEKDEPTGYGDVVEGLKVLDQNTLLSFLITHIGDCERAQIAWQSCFGGFYGKSIDLLKVKQLTKDELIYFILQCDNYTGLDTPSFWGLLSKKIPETWDALQTFQGKEYIMVLDDTDDLKICNTLYENSKELRPVLEIFKKSENPERDIEFLTLRVEAQFVLLKYKCCDSTYTVKYQHDDKKRFWEKFNNDEDTCCGPDYYIIDMAQFKLCHDRDITGFLTHADYDVAYDEYHF